MHIESDWVILTLHVAASRGELDGEWARRVLSQLCLPSAWQLLSLPSVVVLSADLTVVTGVHAFSVASGCPIALSPSPF